MAFYDCFSIVTCTFFGDEGHKCAVNEFLLVLNEEALLCHGIVQPTVANVGVELGDGLHEIVSSESSCHLTKTCTLDLFFNLRDRTGQIHSNWWNTFTLENTISIPTKM